MKFLGQLAFDIDHLRGNSDIAWPKLNDIPNGICIILAWIGARECHSRLANDEFGTGINAQHGYDRRSRIDADRNVRGIIGQCVQGLLGGFASTFGLTFGCKCCLR